MGKRRKIVCDINGKPILFFIKEGYNCDVCGCGVFRYETDGEDAYASCNACGEDKFTIKRELVYDMIKSKNFCWR